MTTKTTPLKMLLNAYNDNFHLDPSILVLIIRGEIERLLPSEREFANDCFHEGEKRGKDSLYFPDFDTYYSQYNTEK